MTRQEQRISTEVREDHDVPSNALIESDDADAWNRLGRQVAKRRSELGLKQEEAAELAGLSLSFWNLLELAKKRRIRRSNVPGIERALGWNSGALEDILQLGLQPVVTEPSQSRNSVELMELSRAVMLLVRRVEALEDRHNAVLSCFHSLPKPQR